MSKNIKLRRRNQKFAAVITAVIAVSVGVGLVSGTFASGNAVQHHLARFSIFSHHSLVRAHRASAGRVSAPAGAILAGVSTADGQRNELYAWHRTPQEDCIVDIEAGAASTVDCAASSVAETNGIVVAEKSVEYPGVNVIVMVPDGVETVTFTNSDGSTHDVGVSNNFANYASANVVETSYAMPGRAREATRFSHLTK